MALQDCPLMGIEGLRDPLSDAAEFIEALLRPLTGRSDEAGVDVVVDQLFEMPSATSSSPRVIRRALTDVGPSNLYGSTFPLLWLSHPS